MKKLYFLGVGLLMPFMADAQGAVDGFRFSQPDMKGTARYMSMGGAFGALGGDLSSISTNPAGIGVYRRNEIGLTMDLDLQSATSETQGYKNTQTQTKFLLNNVGGVASINLHNSTVPNVNFGFTYNRAASFNARYSGGVPKLYNSLSNYIAGLSNNEGVTVGSVETLYNNKDQITFDPYNPNNGSYGAPWLSILGFDSYFITPTGDNDQPSWVGQWGALTSGHGAFDVQTTGGVDEYNIAIGGNISNKVFWGVDMGITSMQYNMTSIWAENLKDAVVDNPSGLENATSNWNMTNFYSANGTGINVKLGVIYRPIQELRLGVSFASPTWYSIKESYLARTNYNYQFADGKTIEDSSVTNGGYWGDNSYNFRTPWKLTFSAAGVIGRNLIVSADLEWQKYNKMRFSDYSNMFYNYGGNDDYWDWGYDYYAAPGAGSAAGMQKASPMLIDNDPFYASNSEIELYYQPATTIRLGAEYRVTPRFSVRAGYAHASSPVRTKAKNGSEIIWTAGTMTNYKMDNSTDYITCGLGYNFNIFYVDAAYVYKHRSSEYHAYTPDPANPQIPSPTSKISLNNSQVVLSMGLKF